jgi:hypothetical protein
LILVEHLVGFLVNQDFVGLAHQHAPGLGAPAAQRLAENVADRDRAHLSARHAGDFEQRQRGSARLHLDLDFLVIELVGTQLLAKRILGGRAGVGADQRADHALLGGEVGARGDFLALLLAHQRYADLDEVAHDLLDVAPDVADLSEFGRLHLDERRAGEPRQAPRNLGLADAGRTDHQDVLRQHLLAQLVVELEPAPAVAQRDGDRALGVALADDEAVEFGNDFARRKVGHSDTSITAFPP